jgi:hypothetical protein
MNTSILGGYDPQGLYCEMMRGSASHVIRQRLSGLLIDISDQTTSGFSKSPPGRRTV